MRHTLTDAQATLAKRRRHPSETRMIDDQQLRELLPRLRRFALSLSRQPACADDLVQATLERALSRWGSKRADSDLRAWLFSNFSTLSAEPNAMPGCWHCLAAKKPAHLRRNNTGKPTPPCRPSTSCPTSNALCCCW